MMVGSVVRRTVSMCAVGMALASWVSAEPVQRSVRKTSVAKKAAGKKDTGGCPAPEKTSSNLLTGTLCVPSDAGKCGPGRVIKLRGMGAPGSSMQVCDKDTPVTCVAPETKQRGKMVVPMGPTVDIDYCAPACGAGRSLEILSVSPQAIGCVDKSKKEDPSDPGRPPSTCPNPEIDGARGGAINTGIPAELIPTDLKGACWASADGKCGPGRSKFRVPTVFAQFPIWVCRSSNLTCPPPEIPALDAKLQEACEASAAGKCGVGRAVRKEPKSPYGGFPNLGGSPPKYCVDRVPTYMRVR